MCHISRKKISNFSLKKLRFLIFCVINQWIIVLIQLDKIEQKCRIFKAQCALVHKARRLRLLVSAAACLLRPNAAHQDFF